MDLFSPVTIGDYSLRNRIVMAPLTRSRADVRGVPSPLSVEYYRARAGAGLIITEGTGSSPMAMGYARTPGIYSERQIAAWRTVADAVHLRGGRIFMQILHVGRIAHPANRTIPDPPIASSAVPAEARVWTDSLGMQPKATPRAIGRHEIPLIVAEFGRATRNALAAGFDGVELHAASGYLPNQFLSPSTNLRTDEYGGSIANRIRFVVEAIDAMIAAAGSPGKVGIKISPGMQFNELRHDDPLPTYTALANALAPRRLAYLHVMRTGIAAETVLRTIYPGNLIVGGGFLKHEADKTLQSGQADAVAFGALFVSNPDLVTRFLCSAPLNTPDPSTFYTPGARGYVDYPLLAG